MTGPANVPGRASRFLLREGEPPGEPIEEARPEPRPPGGGGSARWCRLGRSLALPRPISGPGPPSPRRAPMHRDAATLTLLGLLAAGLAASAAPAADAETYAQSIAR